MSSSLAATGLIGAAGLLGKKVVDDFLQSAALGWANRQGGFAAKAEHRDGHELALRLAGSILFENYSNVTRIRFMDQFQREGPFKNGITFGTFDLLVTEAALPELCKVAPSPLVLERIRRLVAMVRRVDHYQRLGHIDVQNFGRAVDFARDALQKGILDRFNELVTFGADATAATFPGEDPQIYGFFPPTIGADNPIDHAAI